MDWFEPFRSKPSPVSAPCEFLGNGCTDCLHPVALFHLAAPRDDVSDVADVLDPSGGSIDRFFCCPGLRSYRHVRDDDLLPANLTLLPKISSVGHDASVHRLLISRYDLGLGHPLLARQTVGVERARLYAYLVQMLFVCPPSASIR